MWRRALFDLCCGVVFGHGNIVGRQDRSWVLWFVVHGEGGGRCVVHRVQLQVIVLCTVWKVLYLIFIPSMNFDLDVCDLGSTV